MLIIVGVLVGLKIGVVKLADEAFQVEKSRVRLDEKGLLVKKLFLNIGLYR
jgi:hypothetical protein